MSIVLMVIGIVLSMGLDLGGEMNDKANRTKTRKIMSDIEHSIITFYKTHGHLPCPASRTQDSSHPDFGKAAAACNASPATGTVDVDSENPEVTANKEIRVGTVPVRDLGLPATHMTDAWGNRFTYAVIKGLAVSTSDYQTYDDGIDTIGGNTDDGAPDTDSSGGGDTTGIIRIQNKAGIQTTYADKKIMVPFVLVSHGRDGKGSFNEDGGANPTACSGSSPDVENCDDDAVFFDEQMYDIEGDADYFDDYVRWMTKDRMEYDAGITVVNTGSSLPTCAEGQVLKVVGGAWSCSSDYLPAFASTTLYNNSTGMGSNNSTDNYSLAIYAPTAKYVTVLGYCFCDTSGTYAEVNVGFVNAAGTLISNFLVCAVSSVDAMWSTTSKFLPIPPSATTVRVTRTFQGGWPNVQANYSISLMK